MLKYKLQEEKEHLTSAQIAKSVKTNPAYIRQLMAALKKPYLQYPRPGKHLSYQTCG